MRFWGQQIIMTHVYVKLKSTTGEWLRLVLQKLLQSPRTFEMYKIRFKRIIYIILFFVKHKTRYFLFQKDWNKGNDQKIGIDCDTSWPRIFSCSGCSFDVQPSDYCTFSLPFFFFCENVSFFVFSIFLLFLLHLYSLTKIPFPAKKSLFAWWKISHFQNMNHCEKSKVFESHVEVLSMKLLKGKAAKFPRTTFQPHFPSLPSLIWKFIPERRVFWHFVFFRAYLDIANCCAIFLCCLGGEI